MYYSYNDDDSTSSDSEDSSFENYVVTTTDPGPALLIATVVISVLLYAMLPFLVDFCKRRKERIRKKKEEAKKQEEKAASTSTATITTVPDPWKHSFYSLEEDAQLLASNCLGCSAFECLHGSDGFEVIEFDAKHLNWEKGQLNFNALFSHRLRGRGLKGGRVEHRMKKLEGDETSDAAGEKSETTHVWDPLVDALDAWEGVDEDKPDDISGIFSIDTPQQGHPSKESTGIVTRPPFSPITKCWAKFRKLVKWDKESKRLIKLAGPFVTQALVSGVAEAARLSIVAHYYGGRSLAAYVVCIMMIHLTTAFFGSVNDAVRLLTCMSIGVGNTKLTGKYTQVGLVLSVLTIFPTCFFWIAVIGPVLEWFGFDDDTVALGKEFTRTYVWSQIMERMDRSLETLLDTGGHEIYAAVFCSVHEVVITLVILFWGLYTDATMRELGLIFVISESTFFLLNVAIIAKMGWWRKYYPGMIHTFALKDWKIIKKVMVTSIPLSFGYLLTYGEWELLTVFAAFLGPAEVATWGILGTLWDVLEEATEAIAEAAEVRCAYLLGAGKPVEAKNSSFKSMFLAFFVSTILSTIVFIWGDGLAMLMTSDSTLQMLISELIPLFVIGNIALAVGTLAWTLIGSQGRYATSTAVGLVGSWCVTVPLAFLSSRYLNMNLKGQTCAVVIGYMFSGTWNTFLLMTSNWKKISDKVIAYNSAHDIEIDSDQESECDDVDDENHADQGGAPMGDKMKDSFRYRSEI